MTLPEHLPAAPDMLPAHVIDNHTHLGSTTEYSDLGVTDSLDAAIVGLVMPSQVGILRRASLSMIQLSERF